LFGVVTGWMGGKRRYGDQATRIRRYPGTEVHYLRSQHMGDEYKILIGHCGASDSAPPIASSERVGPSQAHQPYTAQNDGSGRCKSGPASGA
jgi:hypothetical protein